MRRWISAGALAAALVPTAVQATEQCRDDWSQFPPTRATPPVHVPPDLAVLCVGAPAPVSLVPVGGGDAIALQPRDEGGSCYRVPDGTRLAPDQRYTVTFPGGDFDVEVGALASAPTRAPEGLSLAPIRRFSCADYGAWQLEGGDAPLYRWRVLEASSDVEVIGPWISDRVQFAAFEGDRRRNEPALTLGREYVVEVEVIALDGSRSPVARYPLQADRVGTGQEGQPMFLVFIIALVGGGLLGASVVIAVVGSLITLVVLLIRRRRR